MPFCNVQSILRLYQVTFEHCNFKLQPHEPKVPFGRVSEAKKHFFLIKMTSELQEVPILTEE